MLPYSDECMLDITVYAKSVGYIGILTYDTNPTITDDITNTGLPFAIIDHNYLHQLLTDPTGKVQVYGSIIVGLIIVTSSLILLICCCCCCCFCIFCCCSIICNRCCLSNVGDYEEIDYLARREELIESILARLQEMDQGLPLGREATKTFPVRLYGDDEQLDSCVICVEDFEVGKKVKELPCQHIFHPRCINKWLSDHSTVCPLCKKDFTGVVGERGIDDDVSSSCSSVELSHISNNNYGAF
jgi:E3 ubiquitin-protein ligase RNF13